MLQILQEKNPSLPVFSVESKEFRVYGRALYGYDTAQIIAEAKKIAIPEGKALYKASIKEFESLSIAKDIRKDAFGNLPTQIGYCYGHNSHLDALEWHCCSELNIAVTPVVLLLATRFDLIDEKLDPSTIKAFYLPAGTVVEVYATTLHYCPCQVTDEGFGFVVALLKGTNEPHKEPCDDKLLFCQNKWLLAHNDNAALLAEGAVAGVDGENFKLNY